MLATEPPSDDGCLPARQRRGLRLLAKLPRATLSRAPLPATSPAQPGSLDDLILDSMARGVARLAAISDACGASVDEIELCSGMSVQIARPMSKTWFADRLREIDVVAQSVASTWAAAWHGVTENDVRGRLLLHDGWAIDYERFKTPPWMEPHTEMFLHKASTFSGCRWLLQIPVWVDGHEWRTNQDRWASEDFEGGWRGPGGDFVGGPHRHDVGCGGQGVHEATEG